MEAAESSHAGQLRLIEYAHRGEDGVERQDLNGSVRGAQRDEPAGRLLVVLGAHDLCPEPRIRPRTHQVECFTEVIFERFS